MTGEGSPTALSMLLEFRATNVRSFRDPLELSLQATAMAEDGVPRGVPWREGTKHPLRVLPAAGIFGANASGKTNLLRVMDDMRRIVLTSFRNPSRGARIPRKPFRLDPDAEKEPSEFSVDLILNGIRHEYGFHVDDNRVIEEWARRYPHGKAATLFRRRGDHVELGESNRAKGRAVTEILRPNSLYLSAAAAANHSDLLPLYEWFESNLILCEAGTREARWMHTSQMLTHDESRARVLDMLHAADLGITDARPRKPDPELVERIKTALRALSGPDDESSISVDVSEDSFMGLTLSHRGSHGTVDFDVSDESLGSLVWLGLVGPVLDTLSGGTVMLADELESSLHPVLVAQLVRTFQDPVSNPKGAQLIFNSHEAGLLGNSVGERILGRDQVWFTEKLQDGRSRLYPLTDLNPRKDEALSRRYLTGRYGATPIISDAEFTALAALVSAGGKEK